MLNECSVKILGWSPSTQMSYYNPAAGDNTSGFKCCSFFLVQGRRFLWDRGDMSPLYLWKGDIHGNIPPIFYPVTATTVFVVF